MNKRELILPILVIGLAILFATTCVAVVLSNGKSKKWLARKMKLGALLLTLTAASCNGGNDDDMVTCYVEPMANDFEIENVTNDTVNVKLYSKNVLEGTIYNIQGENFSYALFDSENKNASTGRIMISDGKIDKNRESFNLPLDKTLRPGYYTLKLYSSGIDGQDADYPQRTYVLDIKIE